MLGLMSVGIEPPCVASFVDDTVLVWCYIHILNVSLLPRFEVLVIYGPALCIRLQVYYLIFIRVRPHHASCFPQAR